jgi:hypothetical protein
MAPIPSGQTSIPNSIQNLNPIIDINHYLIGGDFNIITSLAEKRGGI